MPDNYEEHLFNEQLKCRVSGLEYDFRNHVGVLLMPPRACCDMRGCIALFENIDPDVAQIHTVQCKGEHRQSDTAYVKVDGIWRALDRRPADPANWDSIPD